MFKLCFQLWVFQESEADLNLYTHLFPSSLKGHSVAQWCKSPLIGGRSEIDPLGVFSCDHVSEAGITGNTNVLHAS